MDELIEILEGINPDADYENCNTLVDDGILTSFEVVMLVTQIEDNFDVKIPPVKIVPEIFNSAASIWAMIRDLEGDE